MKLLSLTKSFILCSAVTILSCCADNKTAESDSKSLPRAETPADFAESMDSLWAKAEAEKVELHSLMVVQDDSVIY
ncbi:MAG: hypothetical protein K2K68_03330, partial [Duncaniella sp.]|nr:hypothetical protein [Duncaniella sp.]